MTQALQNRFRFTTADAYARENEVVAFHKAHAPEQGGQSMALSGRDEEGLKRIAFNN